MSWLAGLSLSVSLILFQALATETPQDPTTAPQTVIPQLDPDEDLTHLRCTSCHAASRFTGEHRTADNWEEVIDRMISHGARVSAEEYPRIHAFLTRTQGPLPAGVEEAAPLTNAAH